MWAWLGVHVVTAACLLACICGCRTTSRVTEQNSASNPAPDAKIQGIAFEEIAIASGLNFSWPRGPRPLRVDEAFGAGCAFLDWNNDGWQDILLLGKPVAALFQNDGKNRFEDVTAASRLSNIAGDWKGCAVGDYDGDGWLDVLLNGNHSRVLLHNEGGRAWRDVTRNAGLEQRGPNRWGSSAGFMDLDANGTLDLVICHYVIFGPKEKQYCFLGSNKIKSGCPPQTYQPEFTELWKNLGNGRFQNVTQSSGLQKTSGKALVVAFADINDDNKIDFYIGNDGMPADLMLNLGNLKFRNIGIQSGTAFGVKSGVAMAAMGADWQDYDGDSRLDLAVSGFSDEAYSLMRNMGGGLFEQSSHTSGLAASTFKPLGFGTKWLDADNDGWPDLAFANGHVYDAAEHIDSALQFRQPMMLFQNREGYLGERTFVDIAPQLGGAWTTPILGRGLATGDSNNDGRMDVLVVDYEGAPLLLQNTSRTLGHWITFDLRGRGMNRFAYGAKIVARGGGRVWKAYISPASSYLSSSDPRVHFGLGTISTLDSVSIRWPDGQTQQLKNVEVNRVWSLVQGVPTTKATNLPAG
ncbi:MAG TPA: CRTAC1 family protein [Abditibacteriaceae bacterium]